MLLLLVAHSGSVAEKCVSTVKNEAKPLVLGGMILSPQGTKRVYGHLANTSRWEQRVYRMEGKADAGHSDHICR